MNSICGLWMIRAINARSDGSLFLERSDGSLFLDDMAQWEGKIPSPFRSCNNNYKDWRGVATP
jgi:hypothetical protein